MTPETSEELATEEIIITQFNSFKQVFEGNNSERQSHLRHLVFRVVMPSNSCTIQSQRRKCKDTLQETVQDLFHMLKS